MVLFRLYIVKMGRIGFKVFCRMIVLDVRIFVNFVGVVEGNKVVDNL